MSSLIPLVVLAIVGAIIYFSQSGSDSADKRMKFLNKLAAFVEGKVEPYEGFENSFKIHFHYEGKAFVFEDLEEKVIESTMRRGFLKVKTETKLTLSFTEKARGSLTVSLDPLHNVSQGWIKKSESKFPLPKELKEYIGFTNYPKLAEMFLEDEQVVAVFKYFNNRDKRGRPVMSLEFIEGECVLKFQPPGSLKPQLNKLEDEPYYIEDYMDRMIILINRVNQLSKKLKEEKEEEEKSE